MKLSKEDLKAQVDSLEVADDVKIELLENIEDSVEVTEVDTSELDTLRAELDKTKADYEDLNAKYEELKIKYKERFLQGDPVEVEVETEEETTEGPRKFEDLFDEEGEIK